MDNPLSVDLKSETTGAWQKKKFWGTRPDFGNPDGPARAYDKGDKLLLLPLGTFVLNVIPTTGRGSFKLFSFDPRSVDPLYDIPPSIMGSFGTIQYNHILIPLGDYVLDRLPETGEYWLWSFDPMNGTVLARPAVQEGQWEDIDETHRLIPMGDHVLDWDMVNAGYRLWRFNPRSRDPNSDNPLSGPVRWGPMPDRFRRSLEERQAMTLTCVQELRPVKEDRLDTPGTIDFMRTKIKHVVYYMLENRAFDHVLGWLYEGGQKGVNFIGHDRPFDGANRQMYNVDPDTDNERVYLNQYGLDDPDALKYDPYHDMTDTMRHLFYDGDGARYDSTAYNERWPPHMGGFIWNQGTHDPMKTFTPEKLPVLNGLARSFAVCDEWFCSMPGATDSNRAFALTGSALGQLNNFMNPPQYTTWPDVPHRSSIWKVLWVNGFDDWKIYNSIPWYQFVLTYQLYLKGQIPSLDGAVSGYLAGKDKTAKYIGTLDQFKDDVRRGQLPAFSFLEPVWIQGGGGSYGPATSYHPFGGGARLPARRLSTISMKRSRPDRGGTKRY